MTHQHLFVILPTRIGRSSNVQGFTSLCNIHTYVVPPTNAQGRRHGFSPVGASSSRGVPRIFIKKHLPQKFIFSSDFGHFILAIGEKIK